MGRSNRKFRGFGLRLKMMELLARGWGHRTSMTRAIEAKAKAVSLRVSPRTAEAFGRYLHLLYAKVVQEIFLIMQACLMPLGMPGDL